MFKLAGHLSMTVGQLSAQLSEEELAEWIAYDSLDPIGSYRSDVQTALLAYMQSGSENATLDDFILFDPNPMTDEQRDEQERQAHEAKLKEQTEAMTEYFAYLQSRSA